MTDADVIRKAAELCGWEYRHPQGAGYYWRSPNCSSFIHEELVSTRQQVCGIDALALQLWRKWCEKNGGIGPFSDQSKWGVFRALQDDSLQALRLMVDDMEGVTDA